MAAQKRKKKTKTGKQIFFGIFECLFTPKSIQTKLSTLLIDSSRSYKRPLENQKTEGSRELFLPENDFQTSSIVNFPKKYRDFGDQETKTEDIKFRIDSFFT